MIECKRIVELFHGLPNSNLTWLKKITLRTLDGFDEEFLESQKASNLTNIEKATNVIYRKVDFNSENGFEVQPHVKNYAAATADTIGTTIQRGEHQDSIDELDKLQIIRRMIVGDRALVLFNLRQMMLGNKINFDVRCVHCNQVLSSSLLISDLIKNSLSKETSPVEEKNGYRYYKVLLKTKPIKFRLLNGIDLENIIQKHFSEKMILESCVLNFGSMRNKKLFEDTKNLEIINSMMSELDPLSDIVLKLNCPLCSQLFELAFNIEEYFITELETMSKNLESEIHLLALYYNWSENEILSLPIQKRKRYVQLVRNSLETDE